ncbi:MAG: hypothetical protein ACRDSE_00150 [Pseudonocardiaceae bacterium]
MPEMVAAGLERNFAARQAARPGNRRGLTDETFAARLAMVAELYERDARWWGVFIRWCRTDEGYRARGGPGAASQLFYRAALGARDDAERDARDMRELEQSARRRTAEAAGTAVAA